MVPRRPRPEQWRSDGDLETRTRSAELDQTLLDAGQDWIDGRIDGASLVGGKKQLCHPSENASSRLFPVKETNKFVTNML